MRPLLLLLLPLSACAGVAVEPEDPAALVRLMGRGGPARREEAAYRLSIAGLCIPDALAGDDRALAMAAEDTASVRQGVARALEERDPQAMVWRAWHALRSGCLAREWSRVSDALSRQGFRLVEIYEPHERSKFVRFVAQAGAYVNAAGDRHDLFFWVQAVRRESGAWVVREVYSGLTVKFDAPFKTLAGVDRYPRDGALARFFALPELQKLALVFPTLEELEFTYGRIRSREGEPAPAGFHVNAGFAMENMAGGRSIYYTAESGLDPREAKGGRLVWEGFAPTDSLGPLTPRGSGIWGAGGLKPSDD